MSQPELAASFEACRPRLRAVAYRMLGSLAEADDTVQEAGFGSPGPTPSRWPTSADG